MSYETRVIMNYQYNTCDIIGRGFSSIVFKGFNTITKEQVAIKVIKRQFSDQLPVIQNEIQILSRLQGRNILKFHEHYMTQNNIYIITEYCSQGDLASKIKQFGYLKCEYAIAIVKQIIEGIYVMAQQNIIHRDLKPQNILLNDDGVKIADFGFAKPLNQLHNEMNVGTPLYMSPETITRSQYNAKSDIWSLGVMFYEILYGRAPWQAQTEQELIYHMLNERVSFPDFPVVQEVAKDFIKQCLIIDPHLRLSVTELMRHPLLRSKSRKVEKYVRPSDFDSESTQPTIKSEIPQVSEPWQSVNNGKKLVYVNCKNDQVNKIIKKYLLGSGKPSEPTIAPPTNNSQTIILQVLESQFCLCLFLNNLISKVGEFKLMSPFLNEKCRIIFSKHLQSIKETLHKQLIESDNKYQFKDWTQFYKSTQYQKFTSKFILENKKLTKICEEYNMMVKKNKSLQSEYQKYDSEFYQILFGLEFKVIKRIIKQLILELNHIISSHIDLSDLNYKITKQQQAEITLLIQAMLYHDMIEKFFLNYNELKFALESKISSGMVNKEIKMSDYIELRSRVKKLMSL